MAIFHLSAKIIGRQGGRRAEKRAEKGRVRISASNVVAAAAYRSGQELYDESTGLTYSYARTERVMHTEILAPADAPAWAGDRAALWNSVEATERRKDSQLAREIEVALPAELDLEQQRQLVRDWVSSTFTPAGAVVDIAIHHDEDDRNPHAHLMASMRSIGPEGWSKQKLRQWEERSAATEWRASWADHVNQALERAGHEARVDHRSYADQDAHLPEELRREPTRKVGPWAKGRDRDQENRAIAERNRSRLQRIRDLANRAAAPVREAVATVRQVFVPRAQPTKSPAPQVDPSPALSDLSPLELAKRYNALVAKEEKNRAAAAGIPLGQFQQLDYHDQVELSGGVHAGLPPAEAALLRALEDRLAKLPLATRQPNAAARPAPEAPVPSASPPPIAPEPEMADEETEAAKKAFRDRGRGR